MSSTIDSTQFPRLSSWTTKRNTEDSVRVILLSAKRNENGIFVPSLADQLLAKIHSGNAEFISHVSSNRDTYEGDLAQWKDPETPFWQANPGWTPEWAAGTVQHLAADINRLGTCIQSLIKEQGYDSIIWKYSKGIRSGTADQSTIAVTAPYENEYTVGENTVYQFTEGHYRPIER